MDSWIAAGPYLMGGLSLITLLLAFYLKNLYVLAHKKNGPEFSTRLGFVVASMAILAMSLMLSGKNGYDSAFPKLGDGEVATILAIYDPDLIHNEAKIEKRKRCLIRIKDGRETIINEGEFYHGEINDARVGDPVIKEAGGSIYLLKQINIHRNTPRNPGSQLQSPITKDFGEPDPAVKTPD